MCPVYFSDFRDISVYILIISDVEKLDRFIAGMKQHIFTVVLNSNQTNKKEDLIDNFITCKYANIYIWDILNGFTKFYSPYIPHHGCTRTNRDM